MSERLPGRFLIVLLAALLLILAGGALLYSNSRPDSKPIAVANPPPFIAPSPPAGAVSAGRRLYLSPGAELGCATCHGANAEGSRLGPALLGVVDAYYPRLGFDPARVRERFVNHMIDPDKYPALGPGTGGFIAPMPPYAKLARKDLEALAAYLMSLTEE